MAVKQFVNEVNGASGGMRLQDREWEKRVTI